MAAIEVHKFAQCITCHAWSPDHSMIAYCPNNDEVHIYKLMEEKWEKLHVLKKHDQIVCGVDWSAKSNRIVTVSHDRNSFFLQRRPQMENADYFPPLLKQIVQLDLSISRTFGVKWSPSGKTLAYVGHNSMIYFLDEVGPSPLAQNVALRDLPLRDVLFVSERMLIGVGYDCNPMVFAADETGVWSLFKFLGERKTSSSGPKYGSQLSGAFRNLYGQSKNGASNDAVEPSKLRGGVHENCINCIVPLKEKPRKEKKISKTARFSTSGLDGKVVIWDLENQEDLSDYL